MAQGSPAGILHNKPTSNHLFASGTRSAHNEFSGGGLSQAYAGTFDDDHAPPPTPATQYYHHSTHSKPKDRRPPTHSSVPKMHVSSIPSMKAALVGGISYSSSDQPMESMSPISPAALIGPGHEELMLPPPSPHAASRSQSQPAGNSHQQRQSHMEWLQHINELAKQAVAASNEKAAPVSVFHPSLPQPNGSSMPSTGLPYHGVTGFPTATYGHAPMYYAQAALKQLQQQQSPPPESEEKRAKRLERNRESARKSRRRKKERLSLLEDKVNGLHNQIETARAIQIQHMNPHFQDFFFQRIVELETTTGDKFARDNLAAIFIGTGYNCELQRAVIDFQYSQLKQTLLPRYQKFLLWLTLHPESWFAAGKEQHTKREANKLVIRAPSGKTSSKQVGDELTNGSKLEDGTFVPPPQPATSNANGEKANQTAQAFDSLRMWPLLCFELSISVDQEERILLAYKRYVQSSDHRVNSSKAMLMRFPSAQKRHDLQHSRTQIEAATRMSSRLKETMLLQSHNVAVRGERTYLSILTPTQAVLYHKWLANNRKRCRDVIGGQKPSQRTTTPTGSDDSQVSESRTLMEVCRKLEAVLKISKGEVTEEY